MALPPLLVAGLSGALVTIASSIVARVLLTLGFYFVAYVGFGALLDEIVDLVEDSITGIPAEVGQILGVMKVDICLRMLLSALTIRLTLMGIGVSGTFYKLQGGAQPSSS